MEPVREEVGTWPAALWYLERESGAPDCVRYADGLCLILFSSIERASRFHDEFPASSREACVPRAVEVSRVISLASRHFPAASPAKLMRWYILDPEPMDFDKTGRQVKMFYRWPLTLRSLCGWIDAPR